jgi:hypothetical protein
MRKFLRRSALCVLVVCAHSAETPLHLKNRPAREARGERQDVQGLEPARRRSFERFHVLVQFDGAATPEQIIELERRGVRFVQYVPDAGYLVSVVSGLELRGAGLRMSRMEASDKISPAFRKAEGDGLQVRDLLVAEFYPDVDPQAAREVVEEQGFEVLDHPDLLPNHLLIRGPLDRIEALAEWDEIAYLFPASADLAAGERVAACPGALTALGLVGQYVASVGEGWDGPGRGKAALGYFFQTLTQKLPEEQVRAEILRSMQEWTRYASVTFSPADALDLPRTVNILFAAGDHRDGYPFDGQGKVLAHTFYPAPPNPEPIAGDMHLDDAEEWVIGADLSLRSVDLYSVTLHELGHALGLGHSDTPGTVMYPYYRRVTVLTQEDISAIQELYAKPGDNSDPGTPPGGQPPQPAPLALLIESPAVFPLTTSAETLPVSGSVTGGSGDVQVTWGSDRGGAGFAQGGRTWTIQALPLQAGTNVVTITGADSALHQASRTVFITRQQVYQPPAIRIITPTTGAAYTATTPNLTLSGTASPAPGVVRVEWANSRGGRGQASGTSPWTTGPIALQPGQNILTVTAYDGRGASASGSLTVTYTAPLDKVAPTLNITSPASSSVLAYSATIRLAGTASDNVGVVAVTWSTSFNKSGTATGTSYWNTGDIPLLVGTNTIVVRARDAAGNTSWRSVTVTRR